MKQKKVIIICSGGLDSTTLLYDLIHQGYKIVGVLTFHYGQLHAGKEINCAIKTCEKLKLKHEIVNLINLKILLKSALTNNSADIPEGHYEQENMKLTVVPFRNAIMLMIACGYAVSKGAQYVAYAAHSGDHFIYWDTRPNFVGRMREITKISEPPIKLIAPYLSWNKISILKKGLKLGVPYENTWTCYKGKEKPCGKCGACIERIEAFTKNNIKDPLEYEKQK